MFWDDLRNLLSSTQLYRLDRLISAKLVPIFYALGLAGIGLWAIDHLFSSFADNFGQGLWGILEIIVYGPLWLLALRIVCELILVFLKTHDGSAAAVDLGRRGQTTLLADVSDAIHDLADDDPLPDSTSPTDLEPPGTTPSGAISASTSEGTDPFIRRSVSGRRSPRAGRR